jgi:hypothetical protein
MQAKSKQDPGGGGGHKRGNAFSPPGALTSPPRFLIIYPVMKKPPLQVFPVLFALLTLGLFLLLFPPAPGTPGITSACLVFLTALGWSALIVFGGKGMRGRRVAYPGAALLASLLLVCVFRPFPVEPLQHPLMVALQALGMAGIVLYLHILKKKEDHPHDG